MNTLAQQLSKLSSAEDFLRYFGVSYEESVLNTSRLHILQRFYQYMRQENIMDTNNGAANEAEMFRHMRQLLTKAYDDFVHSTPAKEKVFKVLQQAEGQRISLHSLKESLKEKRLP
ncbi:MAG: nitrogen fixation protein NifW [Oxalobacter sp.]|nr:MAG: nitrogen fixation protein NifW [Oxalobacter sp.]